MDIFRLIEKIISPDIERQRSETERQRKRRVRKTIRDIERAKTVDYIYGDLEDLEMIADHFTQAGRDVEYCGMAIRIK